MLCPAPGEPTGQETALQGLWSLYKGRRGAIRWLQVLFSRLKRLFSCDSAAGSALFMATVLQCSWRRKSNRLVWVRDRDANTLLQMDLAGAGLEHSCSTGLASSLWPSRCVSSIPAAPGRANLGAVARQPQSQVRSSAECQEMSLPGHPEQP